MGGRAVLFVAALAASFPSAAGAACRLGRVAELPVTMRGFWPTVPVKLNGAEAVMVANTGVFYGLVTPEAAKRVKLRFRSLPQGYSLHDETGTVTPQLGVAETFGIAGATLKYVEFPVVDQHIHGVDGILGQNVLGAFDTEFDLANGAIRLFKADGCGEANLAYWAKGDVSALPIADTSRAGADIIGRAQVNGRTIRVVFDSGEARSWLTLGAARAIGLDVNGADARPSAAVHGINPRFVQSWIVPVQNFAIGGETVQNTRLRVAQVDMQGADMVLGADFFLSHRILIARSQGKAYFTYNGGPVFRLDERRADADVDNPAPAVAPPPASAEVTAAPAGAGEALDAEALVRRAKASEVRGDLAGAIADLGRAMALKPTDPKLAFERARLRFRAGQPALATADLDLALKLDPGFVDALLVRGKLRLAARDVDGAEADFQAALRRAPDAGVLIAGIYSDGGQFERAIGHYDAWIGGHAQDPGLPLALNGRCWARALWGRELDQAIADCDAALRIAPRKPTVLDSRGMAHLRRGDVDLAIADYDAALKQQPQLPWSLFGRGLAKARKGDAAGAQADLKAAEALAPGLREKAKTYGIAEETAIIAAKAP